MSEKERQAIIHLLDKQARYEYCIKNNISFSDEDYEAYIIRQSMINKDKEIERLTISLQAQEELTMNWYNKVKKVRDLFYEKCRIKDSDGRYSFNETDIDEFRNLLDKEIKNESD